ncbi:hypothetical protein ES703_52586 [subsurface metagenome]
MDFKFSLGLFIGLVLAGVSLMIGVSQWVGIAILIFAGIWWLLFVNPKSPVRSRWWSISNRLGITPTGEPRVYKEYLAIRVALIAMPDIQIDRISLRIGCKHLLSDWQPKLIRGDEGLYINFPRPTWLRKGQYEACLIAYTPDGLSKSRKFSIGVD